MPYPADHREKIRQKIVQAARRLFNQHGFENVSINEIMGAAGLTRGGFYSYFASKTELYAETLACFFTDPTWKNTWKGVEIDLNSAPVGPQVVKAYLSRQHFETSRIRARWSLFPVTSHERTKPLNAHSRAFSPPWSAFWSAMCVTVVKIQRLRLRRSRRFASAAWSSPARWTTVDTPTGCATPARRSRFSLAVGGRRQRRFTRKVRLSEHQQRTIS